jgi:hypothetical protein
MYALVIAEQFCKLIIIFFFTLNTNNTLLYVSEMTLVTLLYVSEMRLVTLHHVS